MRQWAINKKRTPQRSSALVYRIHDGNDVLTFRSIFHFLSAMANRFRQFRLLLWKNFILQVCDAVTFSVEICTTNGVSSVLLFTAVAAHNLFRSLFICFVGSSADRNSIRALIARSPHRSFNPTKVSCNHRDRRFQKHYVIYIC